jgi:phosphohistidine swiveling domain-containing protein
MVDFNLGKKSVAFGRSQEVPMPEVADVPAASALHAISPPDASWSSINLAEAVPGVMTPPQPVVGTPDDGGEVTALAGVGASGGVVEGRAVVVDQPSDAEIDDGDVLVAHITDPSWVSLMFLASGLVVDIGGMMSHAAVVARELGIPCVMNTGRGTTALHTGHVIRIDGAAGTVEILQRIGVASP